MYNFHIYQWGFLFNRTTVSQCKGWSSTDLKELKWIGIKVKVKRFCHRSLILVKAGNAAQQHAARFFSRSNRQHHLFNLFDHLKRNGGFPESRIVAKKWICAKKGRKMGKEIYLQSFGEIRGRWQRLRRIKNPAQAICPAIVFAIEFVAHHRPKLAA